MLISSILQQQPPPRQGTRLLSRARQRMLGYTTGGAYSEMTVRSLARSQTIRTNFNYFRMINFISKRLNLICIFFINLMNLGHFCQFFRKSNIAYSLPKIFGIDSFNLMLSAMIKIISITTSMNHDKLQIL